MTWPDLPVPPPKRVVVSVRTLMDAIVQSLRDSYTAHQLDIVLRDELRLQWPADAPAPTSKREVIEGYIGGWGVAALVGLARRVLTETDVDDFRAQGLADLVAAYDTHGGGVDTPAKNLIFAADGPKPELVLRDSLNNDIEIVRNAEHCLVYDRPIGPDGVQMSHLVSWWREQADLPEALPDRDVGLQLHQRLRRSVVGNPVELVVFDTYAARYRDGFEVPALIPQVYLHYDPYTAARHTHRGQPQPLPRQRMDFLLLFSDRKRVVLEVDGRQHYADDVGAASPARYAAMVAEDRRLRLAGYEVYRFGGHELTDHLSDGLATRRMLTDFFDRLAERMR